MLNFLEDGKSILVQGSAKTPYEIKRVGNVVSCSCMAWRNLGLGIDTRICKHIKANIDPTCLPKAALARAGMLNHNVPPTLPATPSKPAVRLTPKGKVSTAVGGAVVKETAPKILLAHTWEGEDPTGWWISEKLDGVRAYWDGGKFISRFGNTYVASERFKKHIPEGVVLDGELWMGRGKFQQTVSIVRKDVPNYQEWLTLTFVVYDAPECKGPFEERMAFLHNLKARHPAALKGGEPCSWRVLEQTRCHSVEHMNWMLADVEAMKGEGLMLRQFGSHYETFRSSTLLKVKTFTDAEAIVIGYANGRGKHKNRVGALIVQMPDGKTFKVGSGLTDKERENPPEQGATITYKHQGFTNKGLPRIATFVAVRNYE